MRRQASCQNRVMGGVGINVMMKKCDRYGQASCQRRVIDECVYAWGSEVLFLSEHNVMGRRRRGLYTLLMGRVI